MKLGSRNFKFAEVKGIPIYIHWSFILLLSYVAFVNYTFGSSFNEIIWALIYILAIFLCVTLHELGHALAALRYGIKTKSITLYPIGGVAQLEKIPEKPEHELVVALSGPLVNLVIACILWLWIVFSPINYYIEDIGIKINSNNLLLNLAAANVVLIFFNLLPAFPMDGGRVFRSILALTMDRIKATRIAMIIGQVMAIIFIFLGFKGNPFLIIIGIFIFFGAVQEYQMIKNSSILSNKKVKDAIMTRFTTLTTYNTLQDVIQLILSSSEKDFIVVNEEGYPVGILTRDILIENITSSKQNLSVGECYRKTNLYLSPETDLNEAFKIMQMEGLSIVPVMDKGHLIGIINNENILECMMLGEAMIRS